MLTSQKGHEWHALPKNYKSRARCTVAGEDLEKWMVANGWALAYRRYSLDYIDEEAEAQAARRGIWAGEFVKPWKWRRGKRLGTGG